MTSFACRFMWNSQNQPIFLHDSGGTAHCLNISKKCPTIQLCQHFEKCENKHSSLRLDCRRGDFFESFSNTVLYSFKFQEDFLQSLFWQLSRIIQSLW